MGQICDIWLNLEGVKDVRGCGKGSAISSPKIDLLALQIFNPMDIGTGWHMNLLVIELCDVLQILFYPRKWGFALDLVENVHLDDAEINAAGQQYVFHILRGSRTTHWQ